MVNAPPFFNMLWRIVQPLIPAATKERLFVLRNMKVCLHLSVLLGSLGGHLHEQSWQVPLKEFSACLQTANP